MNRLLILGGAILVLAACDRATAPTISLHDGAAASVKKDSSAPLIGGGTVNTLSGENCNFVKLGEPATDSVLVCDEM